MSEAILETVTALVGLRALERAMAEAAPGTEFCPGTDIPHYPRLSIRSNAHALRMVLQTEEQALFWELLKLAGLRQSGWNIRRFRGDPGALRLWGIVLGLMEHPPTLLALEPLVGMDAKARGHFADLLRWCAEKGIPVSYTAARLKDVMELGLPQKLCLAAPEGWLDADTDQMEAALAAEEEKSWNKLQLRWEEREDGKAAEA
jgi:ABC-type multidrug transport system ATPase subunit